LRIRTLITLTLIIAGIVLIASGVFAATYHYPRYIFDLIGSRPMAIFDGYVYPYTSVGLVLDILGLVMLTIGPLLLLIKLEK
jgi:uncharacterized membrane protein